METILAGQQQMAELLQAVNDLKGRPATASAAAASEASTGPIEPSRDQIEELLAKLREHERVVELDSTRGTRGSASAAGSAPTALGFELVGAGAEDSPTRNPLKVRIQELEMESRNPRAVMLSALKAFDGAADLGRVGEIRTRVAPEVLTRLYRGGKKAQAELREWLRSKELEGCSAAAEVLVLGMVIDRMLETDSPAPVINSRAAELVCLRIYSSMKAFDRVQKKDDWLRPKSQAGAKWKSKVDWMLAEQYFSVDRSENDIDAVDDEVTEKLKKKALFQKHL
eukprot:2765279-Pyramimonas_sp.AAC.1